MYVINGKHSQPGNLEAKIQLLNVFNGCAQMCLTLHATSWTVAPQAPLSMGFPRGEYWSRLPFPSPGDLPDPQMKLLQ